MVRVSCSWVTKATYLAVSHCGDVVGCGVVQTKRSGAEVTGPAGPIRETISFPHRSFPSQAEVGIFIFTLLLLRPHVSAYLVLARRVNNGPTAQHAAYTLFHRSSAYNMYAFIFSTCQSR